MRRNRQSIDGFIPRRPQEYGDHRRTLGEGRGRPEKVKIERPDHLRSTITTKSNAMRPEAGTIRSEIDESLRALGDEPLIPENKPAKKGRRRRREKPKASRKRRIIAWVSAILAAILLGYLGLFVYKAVISSGNLFSGNVLGLFKGDPLKEDANGRSNVLILGVTDDDPDHPGNDLTDTMMVLSIDQTRKDAYMFSVPRDLYVDYGMACPAGMYGKINGYFSCVYNNMDGPADKVQQKSLKESQKFIGDIFGMDIQYGVQVNSVVVRDLVDAVKGIEVKIEGSDGAPGILDRNFDWACNYQCYKVKYDNGTHHLNGEQAMFLAMARGNTEPTYGLGNSNFDREQNQQKIIKALQEKSLSAGTFTSYSKVTGILDGLGDNLRTNFKTSEVRTLVSLAKDIPTNKITSIHLQDKDNKLFDTPNIGGQSTVAPRAGTFDYSEIRAFLKQKMSRDPVVREAASIAIYNGSGVVGKAQAEADKLTERGYNITQVANSPDGQTYSKTKLYRITSKKSATKNKLVSRYGDLSSGELPFIVPGSTDFVIIIGAE